MRHLPMLDNILAQPSSLAAVLRHHRTTGAAALASAAHLLRSATDRIVISGMGASFCAAMAAAARLEQLGHPTLLLESSELLHFGDGSWRPGDSAILISRSGASAEVIRLADLLHGADIPILAITNVPDSPLARLASAVVLTTAPDDHIADQIVAVQSYTATLLTLLLLVAHLEPAGPAPVIAAVETALPQLPGFLAELLRESDQWETFLSGDAPLYLLSRGPALASIHEGSLLFHETAKLPAIPLSSGQFRHGPVEAVAPGTRAIILGSPAPTRDIDASLAIDLARMGAQVRWLGPEVPSHPGLRSMIPWPTGVAELPPALLEVLALQVAAYRASLWRGLIPGDFRYATEVTDQETGFPLLAPQSLM